MNINIEELKKLAQAATAGPWFPVDNGVYWELKIEDGVYEPNIASVCHSFGSTDECNARFMAAANPSAVLELIKCNADLLAAIDDVIDGTVLDKNGNRDDDGMQWDWNCKPQKIEKWMARLVDARNKIKAVQQ